MDVSEYWQENKRFLVSVGAGLLVFAVGTLAVDALYGADLRSARAQLARDQANLRKERFTARERAAARDENDALAAAVATLSEAVAFVPREDFVLDEARGSVSSQYFTRADQVREELSTLAGKQRMRLPADLGLETLKTTREEVVLRHLEALDAIDRLVRHALEAGIERIDSIQVRLDPAFEGRVGVGEIERTRVTLRLTSGSESVVRFLVATQSARFGGAVPVEQVEIAGARAKADEVRADVTFLLVRLHARDPEEI